MGALVAGVAAASVALTAVPDVALAKAKPVTETPGASSATELNAAALYDKVSAANQAKVAAPSNDDAEPAVNQAVNASGPKKTTRTFDSFADFKAELAEDMVTAPSTAKEPKKPTQKSFDATQASTKKSHSPPSSPPTPRNAPRTTPSTPRCAPSTRRRWIASEPSAG